MNNERCRIVETGSAFYDSHHARARLESREASKGLLACLKLRLEVGRLDTSCLVGFSLSLSLSSPLLWGDCPRLDQSEDWVQPLDRKKQQQQNALSFLVTYFPKPPLLSLLLDFLPSPCTPHVQAHSSNQAQ